MSRNGAQSSEPHHTQFSAVREPQLSRPRRQPDFEAGEHARLLHVLVDARISTARQHLMHSRSREELDCTPTYLWDELILGLFNEDDFMLDPVPMIEGDVTRSDIEGIDPAAHTFESTASTLKVKFGQLKSQ